MHRRESDRRRSGFTLIELLIVVAIFALMAFVAAPWFSRISQRNQLRSAAREIHTTLLAARMTAVRNNVPASVRITPGSEYHIVETFLETAIPRLVGDLRIQANVRFASLPPADRVVFTADGRRDPPGTPHQDIVLEGPVRSALMNQITVETWENGRVAFVPPAEWR